jgi:hypothetical protein
VTFLSPWTAIIAAAIAVPLFIALYILRLRRQRQVIASTFLWRQATRDLEVNAPIRKLRISLLFLVQLLLLATLIAAIGEPALRGAGDVSQRLVILIDRSASMNTAVAANETRLDRAKELAIEIIENMTDRREQGMAAILAFGASADVIQGLSTSSAELLGAIRSIDPTDEEADFAAALDLAGSFTATSEEAGAAATELVIISDGGVARTGDTAAAKVSAGSVRFVQATDTGNNAHNLGFVNVSARRDADNPAVCIVFARLLSTFPDVVETTVTLRRGSAVEEIRKVIVPPTADDAAGEASLSFSIEVPEGALVSLAHNQKDALAADNVASLVIPAPRQPRIALVHAGTAPDPYVVQLLEAIEPESLRVISDENYHQIAPGSIDAGREFDLIVFDRVTGHTLPAVPTLSFGSAPDGVTLRADNEDQGQRMLSWDRQHPLLRHVSLDTLVFAGVDAMELPEGAEALARGRSGPIIAVMNARGARHVLVGFALRRSNWPRELSIALFMQNALEHLWLGRSSDAGLVSRPGEPITVRALPEVEEIVIDGPVEARMSVEPGAALTLPALRLAGVYRVEGAAPPMHVVAVAVMSDLETDVRGKDAITVNARPAVAGPVVDVAPQPIWTWMLLAALVIVVAEWFFFLALKRSM